MAKRSIAIPILLLLLTVAAQAETITQTAWYPNENLYKSTDWPNTNSEYASVAFRKFGTYNNETEKVYGILNSVTLTAESWVNSDYLIQNKNPSGSITVNQYTASIRIQVMEPNSSAPFTLWTSPYLFEMTPLLVTLAPGTKINAGSSISGSVDNSRGTGSTDTLSPDLFKGLGSVIIPLFTSTRVISDLGGSGSLDLGQTTEAKAKLTLTYDYTPVATPEPVTMSLIASGLLLLGGLGRRIRV